MRLHVSILLMFLTLLCCKDKYSETEDKYAYVGGEIINPTTDYVVLFKRETVIDTVKLDGRNRFLYRIDNLNEGLYTFTHGSEYQTILLEPKDSIMFRLNTLDFDESLVFTGHGAKKNNYLINEYLENEIEEKYIFKLCQLTPSIYEKRIDSLKAVKMTKFASFKKKHETSTLFEKIAQTNIDYDYYSSKEVYPFVHYGKNKRTILKSLPDDFYAYRKDVNYNNNSSSNYYKYSKFLKYSFSNMALNEHNAHSNDKYFDRYSVHYNLARLKLIDSLILDSKVKDDLLYHFVIGYISKNKDIDRNKTILNSFLEKSESEKHKMKLTSFTNSLSTLKEGDDFPDIRLLDYNNNELTISSILNSPVVISFWSHTYHQHFKDSHKKIEKLRKKYSEIAFIVINIDNYGLEKPKKSLRKYKLPVKNEYIFKNPEEARKALVIHPMTKAFILDKDKKIINSHTNIFSRKFEKQLHGLLEK